MIEKQYLRNCSDFQKTFNERNGDKKNYLEEQRRLETAFNRILWDQRSRQRSQLSTQTHQEKGHVRGYSALSGSIGRSRAYTKTQASILWKPDFEERAALKRSRTGAFSVFQR
jgi:hypothetical protein